MEIGGTKRVLESFWVKIKGKQNKDLTAGACDRSPDQESQARGSGAKTNLHVQRDGPEISATQLTFR